MRSVAIHSYIKGGSTGKGKARAHLHYIQYRGGHDREEGGRQFFDRDVEESDGSWFRKELNEAPDRGVLMHKLILSPGCNRVDLQEYTREVMESLGDSKGLELNWQAVIHKNTDHDHIHVVVLGRDRNGRAVKIDRKDHGVCRAIGDRYLERKHEFDRYFDHSVDRIVREESRSLDLDKLDRAIDLDKLFKPYRDEPNRAAGEKQKGVKNRDHLEARREPRAYMPARRKNRKQRLMEARGRNDFYHDLYVSNMNKQRLLNLREAQPERTAEIDKELAEQKQHDEVRREEIARQVAQLDRILGLAPKKQRERAERSATGEIEAGRTEKGPEDKSKTDRLLDEFIEKKSQLEKRKDREAIRVLELKYARELFQKKTNTPKQSVKPENTENKESEKKEQKAEAPKEIEPSLEPLPDSDQLEIQIDDPGKLNEIVKQQDGSERQEDEIAEADKKLGEFDELLQQFQLLVEQRILEHEKQQKEKEREEKEREEEEKDQERDEEER
jgi:hypothetical protein